MRAAIIGGGAAGMYAAVMLAQAGHSVKKMKNLARSCSSQEKADAI